MVRGWRSPKGAREMGESGVVSLLSLDLISGARADQCKSSGIGKAQAQVLQLQTHCLLFL